MNKVEKEYVVLIKRVEFVKATSEKEAEEKAYEQFCIAFDECSYANVDWLLELFDLVVMDDDS